MRERVLLIEANSTPVLCNAPEDGADINIDAAKGDGKDSLPRFSMALYTGGKMRVGLEHPAVMDLQGMTWTKKSRPVLLSHDPDRIVGHTTAIEIKGSRLMVSGVFSAKSAASAEVLESGKSGFPWQASGGWSVNHANLVFVAEGQRMTVNGRSHLGPFFVARKSVLNEASFVPLGADDNTSARVAAAFNGKAIAMEFEEWLKAKGFDPNDLTDAVRKSLQAMFDSEQAMEARATDDGSGGKSTKKVKASRKRGAKVVTADADDDDADGDDDNMEASASGESAGVLELRAEHARIDKIRSIAKDHPVIAAKAVEEGWDIQKTELEVLKASRPTAPNLGGMAKDGPSEAQVLEAALCMTAGLGEDIARRGLSDNVMDKALSANYRNASISSVSFAVIHAAGMHAPGSRMTDDVIRASMEAQSRINASGSGVSTVSLPGILGNVANKAMLRSYQAVQRVSEQLSSVRTATDFKKMSSYRMTGKGRFEKVGANGELPRISLGESKFENQVETEGAIISLTRKDRINDDLGAFLALPQFIGRQSALAIERAWHAEFLSGSFFTAGNKNLLTGGSSALGIDALSAAKNLMAKQTDDNKDPILVSAKFLFVPTVLSVIAEQLCKDTTVNETTPEGTPKPASNPHANKFTPVSSPYLDAGVLAGGSDTHWFTLADPLDVAVMEIAYLNGRKEPTIEGGRDDFESLATHWRGFFDFGVAKQDPKGGTKSNGA